jgi:hypothetical protein
MNLLLEVCLVLSFIYGVKLVYSSGVSEGRLLTGETGILVEMLRSAAYRIVQAEIFGKDAEFVLNIFIIFIVFLYAAMQWTKYRLAFFLRELAVEFDGVKFDGSERYNVVLWRSKR